MSSPQREPRFRQLDDQNIDCPDVDCLGWIQAFLALNNPTSTHPAFFKCSNQDCKLKVIPAKFSNMCVVCHKTMVVGSPIVQGPQGGPYVHCKCYEEAASFLSSCQRCKQPVMTSDVFVATTCNGKSGYCHSRCVKKRRLVAATATADDE